MGNRATVIFTDGKKSFSPAVYLHWNGGPESIYAFLAELDRRHVRADQDYECARFIQLIGEFFDQETISSTSLGVANGPKSAELKDLGKVYTDHGDNGIYLVNRTKTSTTVRRFIEHYKDEDYTPYLVEMSEFEVAEEHKEALEHEYWEAFKVTFAEITGSKKIEGA